MSSIENVSESNNSGSSSNRSSSDREDDIYLCNYPHIDSEEDHVNYKSNKGHPDFHDDHDNNYEDTRIEKSYLIQKFM